MDRLIYLQLIKPAYLRNKLKNKLYRIDSRTNLTLRASERIKCVLKQRPASAETLSKTGKSNQKTPPVTSTGWS
jgi:hypothetical protein